MKESFNADIEYENKKLEYYRSLNLQPPSEQGDAPSTPNGAGPSQPMAGLSWGEDEQETQIFDRAAGDDSAESIIEADIIYAEDLDAVHGTGQSDDAESISADDPPTVEFDREAIRESLDDYAFKDDAPDDRFNDNGKRKSGRTHAPTAQLPSVEPRRDPHVTSPGAPRPAGRDGRGGTSTPIILGVSTLVILAGLALVYVLWPWPAEVEFQTTPTDVRITVDGTQVYDSETPYTYKVKPGVHTIEIMQEGYEPVIVEQEFQKSTTYKIKKTLEKLETNPTLLVNTTPADAIVEIDGKSFKGASPKQINAFAKGADLTAKIYKTGYAPVTKKVTVEEKGAELNVELEPITFALKLDSKPDDARFKLIDTEDDSTVEDGKTPETIKDLKGHKTYRVEWSRRGYADSTSTLKPSDEIERTLTADLEREERDTSEDDERRTVASATPKPKPTPTPRSQARSQARPQTSREGSAQARSQAQAHGREEPTEAQERKSRHGDAHHRLQARGPRLHRQQRHRALHPAAQLQGLGDQAQDRAGQQGLQPAQDLLRQPQGRRVQAHHQPAQVSSPSNIIAWPERPGAAADSELSAAAPGRSHMRRVFDVLSAAG